MADFSVDYTETGAVRSDLDAARSAVDGLKPFGDTTDEVMGDTDVRRALNDCALLVKQGGAVLSQSLADAQMFLSQVEWSAREVDGGLAAVVSGGSMLGAYGEPSGGGKPEFGLQPHGTGLGADSSLSSGSGIGLGKEARR